MRLLGLLVLALLAGTSACVTSASGEGSGGSATAQQWVCATDPRAETYTVGLMPASGPLETAVFTFCIDG